MKIRNWDFGIWLVVVILLLWFFVIARLVNADSLYAPTPMTVVEEMLDLADVQKSDRVYDLGSGDGRIVIMASATRGCESVGVELDEKLVVRSKSNVNRNGLNKLVEIQHDNILETNISGASVVTLYLMPDLLEKLKSQFKSLKDGTRIVAHDKSIPNVIPQKTKMVPVGKSQHKIYLYVTPLKKTALCRGGT